MTRNETHDPGLTSWVESANDEATDFPVQNLPFAVFRRQGSAEAFRGGVAIGDQVLDLKAALPVLALEGAALAAGTEAAKPRLNGLMALDPAAWSALRLALSRALRSGSSLAPRLAGCLVAQAQAEFDLPATIGDYTDFFTSTTHAENTSRLISADRPIPSNYWWHPLAYHGRASSVRLSGTDFHRPYGQVMGPGQTTPDFGPCQRLDYELELGVFLGGHNALGTPVRMEEAEQRVFGICLLNDWSARDHQFWEMTPLGPFLGKNFLTSISPWIVTAEALVPFRKAPWRPEGKTDVLPYLDSRTNRTHGAFDIRLEAGLRTASMPVTEVAWLSQSNHADAYWTVAQMIAHHAVNGCDLHAGDLLGTGTQSSPGPRGEGCMVEFAAGGRSPVHLPNGESRTFLEDGDTVVFRGSCQAPGARRIGFGECVGAVLPAHRA